MENLFGPDEITMPGKPDERWLLPKGQRVHREWFARRTQE